MKELMNTNNEEWRHDCEVRWVASMPLQRRREYLADVEEKRGINARFKLQQGLSELWKTKNTTRMTL